MYIPTGAAALPVMGLTEGISSISMALGNELKSVSKVCHFLFSLYMYMMYKRGCNCIRNTCVIYVIFICYFVRSALYDRLDIFRVLFMMTLS